MDPETEFFSLSFSFCRSLSVVFPSSKSLSSSVGEEFLFLFRGLGRMGARGGNRFARTLLYYSAFRTGHQQPGRRWLGRLYFSRGIRTVEDGGPLFRRAKAQDVSSHEQRERVGDRNSDESSKDQLRKRLEDVSSFRTASGTRIRIARGDATGESHECQNRGVGKVVMTKGGRRDRGKGRRKRRRGYEVVVAAD